MKFYQKSWFIWLSLIFFAPLGIILLWTQKKYKPVPRVILSVFFLVFFICVIAIGGSDEPAPSNVANNTSSNVTTSQETKTPNNETQPKKEEEQTNDTEKTAVAEVTQETTQVEQKEQEYEIEVTAKELADEFNDNEIRANQNYKGKIAKISGEISDIGEVLGQTYVVLSNEDESFSNFVDVQCFFKDKDEINKIAQKNKGDKVVIIGKIEGKSLNVSVKNCRFVD